MGMIDEWFLALIVKTYVLLNDYQISNIKQTKHLYSMDNIGKPNNTL
jgi:hypothetical protein